MAQMTDIRNGMIIKYNNDLWEVVDFLHVKPGKGAAFMRAKLKNLRHGRVVENTFRPSETFEEIRVEKAKMQYLYDDGEFYVFMDNETFEQRPVSKEGVGDLDKYLVENIEVTIKSAPDGAILGIELPINVIQEIVDCEPNVRGNTASGGGKSATTNTGLVITVPFFVEVGTKVKIDTRTGSYIERV
jgi:elongation factor P